MIKRRENDTPFVSIFGDYNQQQTLSTVFNRPTMTHWKPVLMISKKILQHFIYLITYRDFTGNWIVYLRSYATKEALPKLTGCITLRKQSSVPLTKTMPMYQFQCGISSFDATENEVLDSGNYLLLRDAQVKHLRDDNTILEYSIELFDGSESITTTSESE